MLSSWQKSEDNNGGDSFLDGGVGRLHMNQPSGIVNVKKIHSLLTLVVMVAPLAWVGQTQAKGKPKAEITQAFSSTPRYQTNTIPCPVSLPLETEGKTVTCGVLTVPENYEQPHGR
jgi:hypothetical protein